MRTKAPTSLDVARLAGVSQSTVSYVLTGSRPISPGTRQRVQEAIDKLGYHPNSGARALRSRRSGVIGLLVPEARGNDAVLMTFIGVVSQEAQRFGYDVLLVTAQEGAAGIERIVKTGVCEGLILMEVDRHDERVEAVRRAGIPGVLIGMPAEVPTASAIDLDFERLGGMVAAHAAATGCTGLLLFGGPFRKRHRTDVSRFLDGIEAGVRENGLQVLDHDGPFPEVPQRAEQQATAHGRTAVFGLYGVTEVLFAFAASGRLAHPDLRLIALTGEDLAAVSPALTEVARIDPRRAEISRLAVRELAHLLEEDGAGPRTQLVDPAWAVIPETPAAQETR